MSDAPELLPAREAEIHYASLEHTHPGGGHVHADLASLVHTHDLTHSHALDYAALVHAHPELAAVGHTHAPEVHDHNLLYAPLAHNHDAAYAATGHNHPAADATTLDGLDSTAFSLAGHTHAGGGSLEPWQGKLHALFGDGNPLQPDVIWAFQNTAVSVAGPTATQIGTGVGRLVAFRFKTAIDVGRLRWFQLAALPANTFTIAIYAGTSRIYSVDPMPAGAAGWNSRAPSGLTIPADTLCWFGLGAKLTSTASVWRSPASPIANSLGLATMPGSLATQGLRYAQVALTLGAWPATLPALAAAAFASAGSTGTLPVVFADVDAA